MIQLTSYLMNLLSTQITGHAGSGGYSGGLYNGTLILFTNQIAPTPYTIVANLTEATYSGYARQTAITWGSPILQPDGTYTQLSQLTTWLAAAMSNFVANNIWGWALIDTSASPNLLMIEVFAQPVPIASPGDGFGLVIEYNFTPVNPNSFGTVLA